MADVQSGNPVVNPTPTPKAAAKEPQAAPKSAPAAGKTDVWWGLGRRKTSVARVRIRPGEGKMLINKKDLADYFKLEQQRKTVTAPLRLLDTEKKFDVFVNVQGGGTTGQAGAAMLGIARALKNYDESLAQSLRDNGYLTRDGRMVERKKPGQSGARKRYQFSKR
jgi:small subunit ribosomal protein S9